MNTAFYADVLTALLLLLFFTHFFYVGFQGIGANFLFEKQKASDVLRIWLEKGFPDKKEIEKDLNFLFGENNYEFFLDEERMGFVEKARVGSETWFYRGEWHKAGVLLSLEKQ